MKSNQKLNNCPIIFISRKYIKVYIQIVGSNLVSLHLFLFSRFPDILFLQFFLLLRKDHSYLRDDDPKENI